MLYENLHRISVSEGVLISTATLENCLIPISRLLHFGIEKIGTARHLKRAPWQQVHPYHHSDVPYQEAILKYLCSGTGSMLKSVGCDTSSLQKQGGGEVRVYNCLFRSQWSDSYWSCEKVYRLSTLSWTHLRLARISSLDLPISRAGATLHATCGGVAGNSQVAVAWVGD